MYAAIDAGSNTLRMLIGSIEQGRVIPKTYVRRICRLAGDSNREEGLAAEAMSRTLLALKYFAECCHDEQITKVFAVGTAAFRNAINGKTFAEEVRLATGLPLRVITGEEEARLTAKGVLSVLSPLPENALIVDIGGGSTEYILYMHDRVVWSASYPLGVVRLTEKLHGSSERFNEISKVTEDVLSALDRECRRYDVKPESVSLVGTAGTVTTLAALDMEMEEYCWQRVNNYLLHSNTLKSWHGQLLPMSPTEREALPGMEVGRGDLIVAGLEIILSLLDSLDADQLIASDFGILEGLLLSMKEDTGSCSFV